MHYTSRSFAGMALATVLAPAIVSADTGLFVGGTIGNSHLEEDFSGLDFDANANAYRLFGGFQLGDTLGIEAGYQNFGDFSESVDVFGTPVLSQVSGDGWTLGGTLGIPLAPRVSLFGRAGVFFWDADVTVDGFSIDVAEDENPYFGGGAKVDMTSNLSLTGDWTRYRLDDIDADVYSIGFLYSFGN